MRSQEGARVRVIAGESGGIRGPVIGIAKEPLYVDVSVPPHAKFMQQVPEGHNAFCYVFEGEGSLGITADGPGKSLAAGHLAVMGDGDGIATSTSAAPLRFLLLAAKPIGEPVARHGPFVMNTQEEIRKTIADLRAGTFLG